MSESCEKCKFWLFATKDEDYSYGDCRRFPPSLIKGFNNQIKGEIDIWTMYQNPMTISVEWCGEYKKLSKVDR